MAKATKTTKQAKDAKAPAPVVSQALIKLNKGALSTDVGPRIINMLGTVITDEEKSRELREGSQNRRHEAQSALMFSIYKAAKADPSINLVIATGSDKKAQGFLNNQLGVALGFKVEDQDRKGNVRYVYAPSVTRFMSPTKDEAETMTADERKHASTVRTNFLTMLKKCTLAAQGAIEAKDEVKFDKAAGTLMLTGPETRKQFGTASVLLNEKVKQTVGTGKKATEVTLNAKPSFQAIADRALATHGTKVSARRVDSRAKVTDAATYIVKVAATFVQAVGKLPENISAETKKALESVANAIEHKLG